METTGTGVSSSSGTAPSGSWAPYMSTAVAPACAALRAVAAGELPAGTSAARPATRLRPSGVKYEPGSAKEARFRTSPGAAIEDVNAVVGASSPVSGRSRSSTTWRPLRSETRTSCVFARRSAAPTVSAAGEPPGPEMLPKPGPAGPSLPAGVTTSVFSPTAPATARAAGSSAKAAYGAPTPTRATRAASWASPSPFGSTARSSPSISWSVRE